MGTVTIVWLAFALTASAEASSFKQSCRDLADQSAYVSGHCIVLYQTLNKNRTDASMECAKHSDGHLILIHSQDQIDKLAQLFDLFMPAWCALERDQTDPGKWLHALPDGLRVPATNPPWEANSPSNLPEEDGVLVSQNGIRAAASHFLYHYICEFPEVSGGQKYKQHSRAHSRASDEEAFAQWTVEHMLGCAESCSQTPVCRSFAYSGLSRECHLYLLPADGLQLNTHTDFQVFERLPKDTDSTEKQVFYTGPLKTHILLIGGDVNDFEVYYPDDPSKNEVVYTAGGSTVGRAQMVDGKVLITERDHCHWFDPETNALTAAPTIIEADRNVHASALLDDGTVLVCGGVKSGTKLSTCEKFVNNQWQTMSAVLAHATYGFSMVTAQGIIYAIGADLMGGAAEFDFQRYDPVGDSWTSLTDLTFNTFYASAAYYQGHVIVGGGQYANTERACWKYSISADSWSSIGSLNNPKNKHVFVVFNQMLLALGGAGSPRGVEVFDGSETWSVSPNDLITDKINSAYVTLP